MIQVIEFLAILILLPVAAVAVMVGFGLLLLVVSGK
jgi:nitrate reductase NapE component